MTEKYLKASIGQAENVVVLIPMSIVLTESVTIIYFSSNVEYLMLFDHEGNLLKSYFSSNYIDNFLQNDLLIQKHAFANENILKDIDSLEEKEQLAKLFFNRTNL